MVRGALCVGLSVEAAISPPSGGHVHGLFCFLIAGRVCQRLAAHSNEIVRNNKESQMISGELRLSKVML